MHLHARLQTLRPGTYGSREAALNPAAGLGALEHRVRPSQGDPEGVLVLLHGRGADQDDLFPLLDVFDPDRRLLGFTPRAPLELSPGGFHWYISSGIPTPDPDTFLQTLGILGSWLESLEAETGIPMSRTILGGFSQGTVMTHAMSLGKGRPRPAGMLALSGFMPEVNGFTLDLPAADGFEVAMAHGALDTVIGVEWGRQARDRLLAAGARVLYRESQMGHTIDPAFAADVPGWLNGVIPTAGH